MTDMAFNVEALFEFAQIVVFVVVSVVVLAGGYFWWNYLTGADSGAQQDWK